MHTENQTEVLYPEKKNLTDSEDEVNENKPESFVTELKYNRTIKSQIGTRPVSGPEVINL